MTRGRGDAGTRRRRETGETGTREYLTFIIHHFSEFRIPNSELQSPPARIPHSGEVLRFRVHYTIGEATRKKASLNLALRNPIEPK
ncbi:MAG: hypothetical protein SWY16_00300 [Cyanobacteriota bacterium]|nr:hypothetical protein [Cyanobacteriota bacterium]